MENTESTDDSETETKQTLPKVPFRLLSTRIESIIGFAIPYHLQKLKAHSELIKEYQARKEWAFLAQEQIEASNAVKLLKSDLYELQALSKSVKDGDKPQFQQMIESPSADVISAIASFLEVNSNAMQPLPKLEFDIDNESEQDVSPLICDINKPASESTPYFGTLLTQDDSNLLEEPLKVQTRWAKLSAELSELNDLFKKFSKYVFSQKESVDKIEDNIQHTHDNVLEGTKQLRKAVILQSAAFPVTGAAIGGLLLGPVGAVAGFKLFGVAACALSGSMLGYGAGVKLKKNRQAICDMEMKAITYPSKSQSISTPDLTKS